MTTFTADPYVVTMPRSIVNKDGTPSPEFTNWLEYDNRWKHDIWRYTGGGSDSLSQVGVNTENIAANAVDIEELQKYTILTYVTISSNITATANTFANVTAQCVIGLPSSPVNNDRVVVHKNTGLNSDYIDVTDGVGTKRIIVDQAVLSFRYSTDMSNWVVGA